MYSNMNMVALKTIAKTTLLHISLILSGEIQDPVNIENTFNQFKELPTPLQLFVIDNIYVSKDAVAHVSITDMQEMKEKLIQFI